MRMNIWLKIYGTVQLHWQKKNNKRRKEHKKKPMKVDMGEGERERTSRIAPLVQGLMAVL